MVPPISTKLCIAAILLVALAVEVRASVATSGSEFWCELVYRVATVLLACFFGWKVAFDTAEMALTAVCDEAAASASQAEQKAIRSARKQQAQLRELDDALAAAMRVQKDLKAQLLQAIKSETVQLGNVLVKQTELAEMTKEAERHKALCVQWQALYESLKEAMRREAVTQPLSEAVMLYQQQMAKVRYLEYLQQALAAAAEIAIDTEEIDWTCSRHAHKWSDWRHFTLFKYHCDLTSAKPALSAEEDAWLRVREEQPFAKGQFRLAFAAVDHAGAKYAIKRNIVAGSAAQQREEIEQLIFMHLLAERCVQAFNEEMGNQQFEVAPLWLLVERSQPNVLWTCEPYLTGMYCKFTNNGAFVADGIDQKFVALTHFSLKFFEGQKMLVDLQGVNHGDHTYLTDPAFHSISASFGPTDSGKTGIDEFLAQHSCNVVCSQLGLQSASSYRSNSWQ